MEEAGRYFFHGLVPLEIFSVALLDCHQHACVEFFVWRG